MKKMTINFNWKDYRLSEDLSNREELIFDIVRDRMAIFVSLVIPVV